MYYKLLSRNCMSMMNIISSCGETKSTSTTLIIKGVAGTYHVPSFVMTTNGVNEPRQDESVPTRMNSIQISYILVTG